MASIGISPSATSNQAKKLSNDSWNSNPPQVTSYLTYPATVFLDHPVIYTSPNCGLGWRFQIKETHEQVEPLHAHVQDIERKVDVTFHPHMCSSMPLSTVRVNVKVSFPFGDARSTQETEFTDISLKCNQSIGSYTAPPQCEGQVDIEITLTFSDSDGLSFPTTSPPNAAAALQQSLDASSFVDSKFYLFSAKVRGRPTRPRAVYAKSTLLTDRSSYLRDLISSKMDDMNSTPCDLREDVPDEVKKLDGGDFDYEDDSDLEDDTDDLDEVITSKTKTSNLKSRSPLTAVVNDEVNEQQCKSPDHFQDGRAYAINGTAYKTWKAFIYHTYTNEIHFNELKSQQSQASPRVSSTNAVGCSPKSMYRFAESANIPHLKSMAKASILRGLSQRNIITELFSVFTSRYQEIIELEVDFLLKNLTEDVADRFDDVLQTVVSGGAPHCFRVLAFTLRRLRGASAETAWGALRRCATRRTQTTMYVGVTQYALPAPMIQQGGKQDATAEEDRLKMEAGQEVKGKGVTAFRAEAVTTQAKRPAKEEQEVNGAVWEARERADDNVTKAQEPRKAEGELEAQAEMEAVQKAAQEAEDLELPPKQKTQKKAKTAQTEVELWAREGAERGARDKEERERAEQERKEKEEKEGAEDADAASDGGSKSILSFGSTRWGSPSSSGGSWGLCSWDEKAKLGVQSNKNAINSALGSQNSGGVGFGGSGGDSRLPPEELALTTVGGKPTRNSSSLFDDWNPASTVSSPTYDLFGAPATERAGHADALHDLPRVPSKAPSQAAPKAQSRAPSRVPSPGPVPAPPIELDIVPTSENTVETAPRAPLGASIDTPAYLFNAKDGCIIPFTGTTTRGTLIVEEATAPGTLLAKELQGLSSSQADGAISRQRPVYVGTIGNPPTAEEVTEPSLNSRATEPSTFSSVSSRDSSLAEIPSEVKERNRQAIIIRAKIHELTKKILELEDVFKARERGDLNNEIVLKEQEIRKAERSLGPLKRRAEQLHEAAVESTSQLTVPEILILNFENSSPEDAVLRLEDILGLLFDPERKSFKLKIILLEGDPGKPLKVELRKLLSEYGIKSKSKKRVSKPTKLIVNVAPEAYIDLITTFRQSHPLKDDE